MSINDSLADLATTLATELPLLRAAVGGDDLAGTNWPVAPVAGQLRFRTDLGLLCYYDGARWVTANEYSCDFAPYNALSPHAVGGGVTALLFVPRLDYRLYITRWQVREQVLTTNNGSNYWTITLSRDGTSLATFNTSTDTANTAYIKTGTINAPHTALTLYAYSLDKVGAPGNLNIHGGFAYRLVVT